MTNTDVKRKISNQSKASLGDRIREIRVSKMQADQKSFARLLGVSQAIVSQWENNKYEPSAMALMSIGNLAGTDADWWFEQAGPEYINTKKTVDRYKELYRVNEEDHRTVLIYGEVGTGPFRCIPEDAVDRLAVPRVWFSDSAQIVGLLTQGDSMSPLIETGYIALVDRGKTDHGLLVNCIVAVGDGEGLSLKWLRKAGREYLLVPENQSIENQIIPMTKVHRLFGRVERCISGPLSPRT